MQVTIQQLRKLQCKGEKVEVTKGCTNDTCYCSGACKEVVGYWENGVYTAVAERGKQAANYLMGKSTEIGY